MLQRYTFYILIFSFLFSCAHAPSENHKKCTCHKKKSEKQKIRNTKKDSLATDPKTKTLSRKNLLNEISAILGGVDDSANVLNHLYDTLAWKEHKKFMNESWKKLETNRIVKLEQWGKVELAAPQQNGKTVFYPFSGPDFLTANAFFPQAEKLIMLGLEPIGDLPKINLWNNQNAKSYCEDFKKSLSDIFNKSYFITAYMLRDFQQQKVNGLLPVLCFFIKKTGHQIEDIHFLVKRNDSIAEQNYEARNNAFGVKITCTKNNVTKNIYYFKYDVSNQNFNDSTVFYKFINRETKEAVTYVKSASYLLHAGFMSNMKKLILRNSHYILEDDTGIPYADIQKNAQYDIKLYGKYDRPVKDFPYLKLQPGILDAFKKDSASIPPLPFHLGYHWASNKDLLILCSRKLK